MNNQPHSPDDSRSNHERHNPRSLYLHVPFCRSKCGYCDFYSISNADNQLMRRYARAIKLEARRRTTAETRPLMLDTAYFGGGTPSALPADLLADLVATVTGVNQGDEIAEFTVEANPESFDEQKAAMLRRSGVNRLSLGIQSLDERTLAALGRKCSPDRSRDTVKMIRRADFYNFSLDIIFGVPGQTLQQWLADLEAVLALESEHLSVYGLSIEPQTPLGRAVAAGHAAPVDEELYVEMMLAGRDRLRRAGYEHYEISNYARPGRRSRHNLTYWHNEPYVGLGPAAASFLSGRRSKNIADVVEYCQLTENGRPATAESERLEGEAAARETAMLALRLTEGLDLAEFRLRTGYDPTILFSDAISQHAATGMIEINGNRIRLSDAALPLADSILADFVVGEG